MEKLLYIEIDVFCMAILFLMFIKVFSHEKLRERKILNMMFFVMMSFFAFDILWKIFDGTEYKILIYISCALYFAISGVFAYIWLIYCELFLNTRFFQNKINYFVAFIPALALIIASFVKNGIFYIDSDNCYQRGSIYLLQPIVSFGYMIYTSVRNLIFSKDKGYTLRIKAKNLSGFSIYPIALGLCQVFIQGTPLITIGITISIVSIFMEVQKQKITKDSLTDLNNRMDLLNYLESRVSHYKNRNIKSNLWALYLDIDSFKTINDTYGHQEGDNALCLVAKVLKEIEYEYGIYVSRIGGDEFVIICELKSNDELDSLMNTVKEKISSIKVDKGYVINVSIGSSKFDNDKMDIAKLLEYADKKLYKEKNRLINNDL